MPISSSAARWFTDSKPERSACQPGSQGERPWFPGFSISSAPFFLRQEEIVIVSALFEKFMVATHFDDPAGTEDKDAIKLFDSCELMGDDDHGLPFLMAVETLLNEKGRFSIDRRGRFIEDQERGTLDERAGKADTLALATGETAATLTDDCLISIQSLGNEVVGGGIARCFFDLRLGCIELSIGNIFTDRRANEKRLLQDDSNLAAE